MSALAPYRKAIIAFVVSLAGALLVVLPADGGLGDLTLAQWLGVVITVLGTTGGTYAVPNAIRPAEVGQIKLGDPLTGRTIQED